MQCLRAVKRVFSEQYSERGGFGHSSNHVFRIQKVHKYSSFEADLFFQNARNFMSILKMQEKSGKRSVALELMAFGRVAQI